ncbi:hypothetical protein [Bacillus cereus]|uniref:hypothetical protein n=1 Tax=Bacillus cereus TaxID=1396 RepID=UPI00124C7383|nr:hypothetical protein [Bacillus cereus]KAB2397332.1 hypothetical protein F8171_06610 [Bacillus cereus]
MELNLNGYIRKGMQQKDNIELLSVATGNDTGSCVVKGTTVLVKGGNEKPIEDINVFSPTQDGDTLLNIHGSEVYPVALISGPVSKFPIVSLKIKTETKSYEIKVSIWHSLLKNHFSLTPAFMFVKGDSIMTSTGVGIVTSVHYEEYKGDLWNVFLASKSFINNLKNINDEMMYSFLKNSLLGLQPKEHLIMCNGIVSGSYMIQKQVAEHYSQGININKFI